MSIEVVSGADSTFSGINPVTTFLIPAQLAVKEEFHQPGSVRLFQTHTDSEPVDVTELISTAGYHNTVTFNIFIYLCISSSPPLTMKASQLSSQSPGDSGPVPLTWKHRQLG